MVVPYSVGRSRSRSRGGRLCGVAQGADALARQIGLACGFSQFGIGRIAGQAALQVAFGVGVLALAAGRIA